jgi:integrase
VPRAKKKSPREVLGIRYGEGYVQPRGKRWQARWTETRPDGTVRSPAKSFATQDEAVDFLREIAQKKRDRAYVARDGLTVTAMTIEYMARGALRWSTNTTATYTNTARTHIDPTLGTMNVHDLTGGDVQRWVDQLTRSGLSASVIENALHIVSGAYREGMRFGTVSRNPAVGVKPPPRPRVQMNTWTAEEARTVLADPQETIQLRALYRLALTTGMRPGELRGLQWRDVDLDRGIVHVHRSMTRDAQFRAILGNGTKTTGSRRSIAIPAGVVDVLHLHRSEQAARSITARHWDNQGMVFDNGEGRFLSQQTWKRQHDRMCARLGITQIRLHDIRHSFATLMLERNVHPKVISEIMGHSSIRMTLDRYSHVSESLQRSATDALEHHLSDTTTRRKHPRKRTNPRSNPRTRSRMPVKSRKVSK